MPIYEYRCERCGPFERRGEEADAAGAPCPTCAARAARMFSAPGGRGPRRARQLAGLSASALRRVDQAQAGAAAFGRLPAGVRLDGRGRPLAASSRGSDDRRPWQLGH